MPDSEAPSTSRGALLQAARTLISSHGENVSMRAICANAQVQLPTLYHYFGSRQGLIDAVVADGFERYLDLKNSHFATSTHPMDRLRSGWSGHLQFAIDNPVIYTLMYGRVVPAFLAEKTLPMRKVEQILHNLLEEAYEAAYIVMPVTQAARMILSANIGAALELIKTGSVDTQWAEELGDAVLAGVTGLSKNPLTPEKLVRCLSTAETGLLNEWISRVTRMENPY